MGLSTKYGYLGCIPLIGAPNHSSQDTILMSHGTRCCVGEAITLHHFQLTTVFQRRGYGTSILNCLINGMKPVAIGALLFPTLTLREVGCIKSVASSQIISALWSMCVPVQRIKRNTCPWQTASLCVIQLHKSVFTLLSTAGILTLLQSQHCTIWLPLTCLSRTQWRLAHVHKVQTRSQGAM